MENQKRASVENEAPVDVTEVPAIILEAEDISSQGNMEGAAQRFLDACECHPDNPRAWNGLGVSLFGLGQHEGALEALAKALELDPEDVATQANLNHVLWETGDRARAVPLARRLLKVVPDSAELQEQVWTTGVEQSDFPEALLVSTGLEMGEALAFVALTLESEGFVIRGLGPDLIALLSSTENAADVQVITDLLEAARPAVLVLSAEMEASDTVQALAVERGIPVLLLGTKETGSNLIHGVPLVGKPADVAERCRQVVGQLPARPAVSAEGPPVVSVVLQSSDCDGRVVDAVDRLCFQGVHPCLIEAVVVAADPDLARRDLAAARPPFGVKVARDDEEARRMARGRYLVRPFFKELREHGALVRRIQAARMEKPVQLGGENLVSRSTARVCALVRGWGNVEMTTRALAGLRAHHSAEELRIIYVDNGSEVNDFNGLTARFEDVEFVRFPSNLGSCRGINAGMVLAALEPHEFVILMDNDAAPPAEDPSWLERWIACFKDPTVGCAGAVTDYVCGGQHIEACPETYMREFSREDGAQGKRGTPRIPVVVSFAVMFRRSALEAVGWLADERFEPGNSEDTDLSLRVREAGWDVVVAQSVWIHHEGSQTFSKYDFEGLLEGNTEKLVEKYGDTRLSLLDIEVNR